eukprot:scaffold617_cov92-Isochrysis_galbana.AAC.2
MCCPARRIERRQTVQLHLSLQLQLVRVERRRRRPRLPDAPGCPFGTRRVLEVGPEDAGGWTSAHSSGGMPSTRRPRGASSDSVAASCSRNGFLDFARPPPRLGRPLRALGGTSAEPDLGWDSSSVSSAPRLSAPTARTSRPPFVGEALPRGAAYPVAGSPPAGAVEPLPPVRMARCSSGRDTNPSPSSSKRSKRVSN